MLYLSIRGTEVKMKANSPGAESRIGYTAGYYYSRYAWFLLAGVALLSVVTSTTLYAATSISQGYMTSDKLLAGSIVSLQKDSSDQVFAASTGNVDSILGVVINPENSLLSLSNGEESQVQVATSGTLQVLVSDINGTISRGDQVTASPIKGIGMKATGNVRVVGIAQSDLAGNGSKQSYKDKDGREHSVMLGEVPVLVNVSYFFKEPEKTVVPSVVQSVANALAGKDVSTTPIFISAAIFIITVIVVVSIIYSMIRSSIISVGRNPMSQSAIYRNLIQLSVLVLVILGVGFSSIYMVLTRL